MPELDFSDSRSVKKQMQKPIEKEILEAKLSELIGKEVQLVSPELLNYQVPPDEHFWGQHGGEKEQYFQLVKALPKLYEAVAAENDLSMFFMNLMMEDSELYSQAIAWLGRVAINASVMDGKYMCDDGRHRTYAAIELGIPIPVVIESKWRTTESGDLEKI